MTFTLCPTNEIKLLACLSCLAITLLTGPVIGLILGWRRGWVRTLAGLALVMT